MSKFADLLTLQISQVIWRWDMKCRLLSTPLISLSPIIQSVNQLINLTCVWSLAMKQLLIIKATATSI